VRQASRRLHFLRVLQPTAAGLLPSYPRAAVLYANSVQIGLLKTDEPGLVDGDTKVDLQHGLEHGASYPLSVKLDATGNAGAYRLQEIFVAPGDD
jgi:hypothetical protein